MRSIVFNKFSQNEELKRKLIATQDLNLYECTGNRWWGSGLKLDSPEWATSTCPGLNKMGSILMDVRKALRKKTYNNDALTKSPGALIKSIQRHNRFIQEDGEDDFPTPVVKATESHAKTGEAVESESTEPDNRMATETEEVGADSTSSLTDNEELMDATDAEEDSVNISASSSITSTASATAIGNVTGSNGKLDISKIRNWTIPKVNEIHHSLRSTTVSARTRRHQLRNTLSTDSPTVPPPKAASTPQARMNQSELLQRVRSNLHPAQKKKKPNP